ncbi:MAG TPA: DUF378 domain-containing protein [Candidatus Paceibacterota bacterium]|nr:DUF378 domain-containing protein [Candidatus Paceibacterota bacterium]
MRTWSKIDWAAMLLLVAGGINWGVIGVADVDLFASLFGKESDLTVIAYTLVGLAAVYVGLMVKRLTNSDDALPA